jgi:membrane-associated phospholipid phosphatase
MNKLNSYLTKPLLQFLLLGIFTFPGSLLASRFVQSNGIINKFDYAVYSFIYHLPHTKLMDAIIFPFDLWFSHFKKFPNILIYFYIWLALFFALMGVFRRNKILWALGTLALGYLFSGWLLLLDNHFAFRTRPFTHIATHIPLGAQAILKKWTSFPSGHVRDTTLFATIMIYFLPQLKWLLAIFVIFIAVGRIYTGAHYPTDVIAGIIYGYTLARMTIIIIVQLQLFFRRRNEKKSSI